jgi:hypothetical protein
MGIDIQLHTVLTTSVLEGEWSASYTGCFTPQGKSPWYLVVRRLGGPQSQSGYGGKEKEYLPLLGIEPWSPSL